MIYNTQVESSAISNVKYNSENGLMSITFIQGREYDYPNVPLKEYYNLIAAESVGRYFNQHIKKYSLNFNKD